MKYTVTGKVNGRKVTLTHEDGKLTGDPLTISTARVLAQDGVPVSLPGLGGGKASTTNPNRTAMTLNTLFDNGIETWQGDTLKWPAVPVGAIT